VSLAPTSQAVRLSDVQAKELTRIPTGSDEFDRVLGGGFVPGGVVLIGGDPGIGKSTLLLQALVHLSATASTLYVTGEESVEQVALRAQRLSLAESSLSVLAEIRLEEILAHLQSQRPSLVVVDSIQTMFSDALSAAPGSVSQVRECSARLTRWAKESGCTVILVGHVTKEGTLAGPRVLEHIVDTVLYFEGEGSLEHRVLRATKNRFGSVDEIGVFRMLPAGLVPVENPSALFLGDREAVASGSAVTALMEGTRPVLVEVQALAARAGFGTPQRVATGIDGRRLALLLAVLDKRGGISCAQLDVFCNVVGGMRVQEPVADLAVIAALASSVADRPLPSRAVFLGEVGLGGEIRPVSQVERRLAEAAKLGMTQAFLAERGVPRRTPEGLTVVPVASLGDLLRRTVGREAA
jgi:DNA repair protein RadA/Sms